MSHLEYYTRHNISPVRYDLSNLGAHFQRRAALYRTLGLLPLTIRGANVLEVAAGTGQNSLYLAALRPARLTLLEPNPAGARAIRDCYKDFPMLRTEPTLVESRLEDYDPAEQFDIVICENWLGASARERRLLKKLARFVAPRGVLVITCVSPAGFLANIVRRALAARLAGPVKRFDEKTKILVAAFASHLGTLTSMTRTAMDWVHDNMLNPVYFDLCLTVPMVMEDLGRQFQAVGASPDFRRDWRWFKGMHGASFGFNQVLIEEYYLNCHNFLDYRHIYAERPRAENQALEEAGLRLIESVRKFDKQCNTLDWKASAKPSATIARIGNVQKIITNFATEASRALGEAVDLLSREAITADDIARLRYLSAWFGRETLYVSLERVVNLPAVSAP